MLFSHNYPNISCECSMVRRARDLEANLMIVVGGGVKLMPVPPADHNSI